jgi:hypothetical protein
MSSRIAFGFRVRSGHAIAVALRGPVEAPTAVARHLVLLSDPDIEATRQPYHAGMGIAQTDMSEITRLTRIIERSARRSVASFAAEYQDQADSRRACLIVGSLVDPAEVGGSHIRAHAYEGRLFRTVLESALQAVGIRSTVVVKKSLGAEASTILERSQADISRQIAQFGRTLGSPWRADEKAAATAAWMALQAEGARSAVAGTLRRPTAKQR